MFQFFLNYLQDDARMLCLENIFKCKNERENMKKFFTLYKKVMSLVCRNFFRKISYLLSLK